MVPMGIPIRYVRLDCPPCHGLQYNVHEVVSSFNRLTLLLSTKKANSGTDRSIGIKEGNHTESKEGDIEKSMLPSSI
jgi:hypothetical protein